MDSHDKCMQYYSCNVPFLCNTHMGGYSPFVTKGTCISHCTTKLKRVIHVLLCPSTGGKVVWRYGGGPMTLYVMGVQGLESDAICYVFICF